MKIFIKLSAGIVAFLSVFILLVFYNKSVKFFIQDQFIELEENVQDSIQNVIGKNYFIHNHENINSFMISNNDESPLRIIRDVFTWKKIDISTSFVVEGTGTSMIKYIFFLKDKESQSFWSENIPFRKICLGNLNGKGFKIGNQEIFILDLGYVVSFVFENEEIKQGEILHSLLYCKK